MEKFDLESFPTSESAQKMLSYVSSGFYDKSYVGKWIYQVMGIEYDKVLEIVMNLPEQFFPETATWGLMYHEIKWGLPVRLNLSYEERRKLIYQKRDFRAPMTPYRMEKYLETMTGFEVHIADTNDLGEYGFVAPHPNVFKAYFLGEESLNSKFVHGILNELKQSHTIYIVNDRIEIEIYNTYLERIKLAACVFTLLISFWGCDVYNGMRKYNGASRYNAKRNYGLRLKIKSIFELYMQCDMKYVCLLLHTSAQHETNVEMPIVSHRYCANVNTLLQCDVRLHAALRPLDESLNGYVETKRNVVFYNGARRYNGTMKYNALYKKEEVE